MEKQCVQCHAVKDELDFYTADKKCKECRKALVKQNRENRSSYYREYDRQRANLPKRVKARKVYAKSEAGKKAIKSAHQAYIERHKKRRQAQVAVGNALRDGKIKKLPCFVCGEAEVEGHHPDYDAPLSVVWLCGNHHREIHLSDEMKEFYELHT